MPPKETSVDSRAYTDKDYPTLIDWLAARRSYLPSIEEMPKVGLVVRINGNDAAIGFLRSVEGNLCQLDGLTTNPALPSDDRHAAICACVPALLSLAKAKGFARVYAMTVEPTILQRALSDYGFEVTNHVVMIVKP